MLTLHNSLICDTSIQVQNVIFQYLMMVLGFIELEYICDPLSPVASAAETLKPTFPGDLKIDIAILSV